MTQTHRQKTPHGEGARKRPFRKTGVSPKTEAKVRQPVEAYFGSSNCEKSLEALKTFFDAEAKSALRLIPLEREVLDLGTYSYLDLCDRLEKGENLRREPFIGVFRTLQRVLEQIPETRWQILRGSVDRLVRDVDDDVDAGEGSARVVMDILLQERDSFLDSLEDRDSFELERRFAEARELSMAAALELRDEIEEKRKKNAA